MATVSRVTQAVYQARFDDQMTAGAAAAARSMKNLGASVVETEQVVSRSTKSAEAWVRSHDPITAAAQRVERAQRSLAQAQKALAADIAAGGDKAAAAQRSLAELGSRAQKAEGDLRTARSAFGQADATVAQFGNTTRLTTREMQQLSPQIADFGAAIVGGMNPLMVLIQHGPQITDALGGIGRTFEVVAQQITVARVAAFGLTAVFATVLITAEMRDSFAPKRPLPAKPPGDALERRPRLCDRGTVHGERVSAPGQRREASSPGEGERNPAARGSPSPFRQGRHRRADAKRAGDAHAARASSVLIADARG